MILLQSLAEAPARRTRAGVLLLFVPLVARETVILARRPHPLDMTPAMFVRFGSFPVEGLDDFFGLRAVHCVLTHGLDPRAGLLVRQSAVRKCNHRTIRDTADVECQRIGKFCVAEDVTAG